MYTIFRSEEELVENLKKEGIEEEISKVNYQVMEFLESTEEANLMVKEVIKNEETGEEIGSQGEQEVNDCEIKGLIR